MLKRLKRMLFILVSDIIIFLKFGNVMIQK